MQWIPFIQRIAAERRGGGFGADQSCGRKLAAGHPINRVVNEEDRDILAAIGRVQNLRRTDGRQIAVALIAEHDALGASPLHRRRDSGRAPVRGLHVADVEIIIREHRTSHWTHQDGAVLNAQFVDGLRDQLVRDAVAAAGAVVRSMLQVGFAVEVVIEAV